MQQVNGRIVVSVVILMAAGVYRILVAKTSSATITRVIVGGYLLALVASIIDLVGGPGAAIAGLLLPLAVVTVLFAIIPDLFSRITARKGA